MRFYDAALTALGLTRLAEFGDEEEDGPDTEVLSWGPIWLVVGDTPTRGMHVRLTAPSRAAVDAFHAAALAAGGTSHDAPRRWAIYRTGEYNAIVADPAGNLIEAVAREA